jgi:xylulokinase
MDESKLFVGLDSSTQSLSAVAIEVRRDERRVVLETSLLFDEALSHYGTRHGVLPRTDPAVVVSSPIMWAEALDMMLGRLARSGIDSSRIVGISGSAQQHGSVYLNDGAAVRLSALDPQHQLAGQVQPMLSRTVAPVWMDSSTAIECREITAAVGGQAALSSRTGSRAFERFTGPQIRKFFKDDPSAYHLTTHVHLVSSFLASLLIGRHAPVDPGDGSGMNLMELSSSQWWTRALEATAPGLASKLPEIVPASRVIGRLAPYWQERYGLPAAKVVVWSGDNPCSLVGVGLVRQGRMAVSLGTSDTVFGLMEEPTVDAGGTGHVFGAPTGDYMGLTCFSNGSLARERVRDAYGLSWSDFSRALEATPAGNGGRIMLPWFDPEITPTVTRPGARRFGLSPEDAPANVRAVVEGQLMAMALHSRWMGVEIDKIHATGGAAANRHILQVMADVFGAEVQRFDVSNSAAMGAALRALHAVHTDEGQALSWDEVITGFVCPLSDSITPEPQNHQTYRRLITTYEDCETRALREGDSGQRVS